MISAFLALLTAIPGIGKIITGVTSAYFNAKVQIFQARTGATKDVAVAAISGAVQENHDQVNRLNVIAGNKALTYLVVGFALPLMLFLWQSVVWDKLACPHLSWLSNFSCTTDPLKGQIADWATTIIACLFGSGAAITVSQTAMNVVAKLKE